mgnify:FL=1|jgi:hypothetical protein
MVAKHAQSACMTFMSYDTDVTYDIDVVQMLRAKNACLLRGHVQIVRV